MAHLRWGIGLSFHESNVLEHKSRNLGRDRDSYSSKTLKMQNNFRYWQHFLFFKFETQESFSSILQTKNPLEILETFLSQKNFFESYKQKVQF